MIFDKTFLYRLAGAVLLAGAALLMFACQGVAVSNTATGQDSAPTPPPTPLPAVNTPRAGTPVLESTVTPEEETLTLTVWTVEAVSPMAGEEAARFFEQTVQDFELANPNIDVKVFLKKPTGKGGVLDFLRTSKKAAPAVLPDVVVMQATDLNQAFGERLIQPLDGKLDRSIVQDLLPASRRVGTVNEKLAGVPLGIEMEHTVYNTGVFTGTPIYWGHVLGKNTRYLFPAKGVNGLVNDVTLAQYFSAGGELVDQEGTPKIDDRALNAVLTFYEQARSNATIDLSSLEAGTTEELWPEYLAGRAGIAQLSVSQYLTDRGLLNSTQPSALPVEDAGKTPSGIMHAWVLTLVTDNIDRQDAALRLLETFLDTENNATWNEINKSIPVRDSSYQLLAGDDPYWLFLTEQLNTARPEPRFTGYDRVGRILQQAVEQVIGGEATAAEATNTAVDAFTQ
ncbi:MAG: extracellular solute-binding protein [Chloroflexi bacterium]|nr:MAG: extracellular solute-binding protein [Chloroflexota bacterium]